MCVLFLKIIIKKNFCKTLQLSATTQREEALFENRHLWLLK